LVNLFEIDLNYSASLVHIRLFRHVYGSKHGNKYRNSDDQPKALPDSPPIIEELKSVLDVKFAVRRITARTRHDLRFEYALELHRFRDLFLYDLAAIFHLSKLKRNSIDYRRNTIGERFGYISQNALRRVFRDGNYVVGFEKRVLSLPFIDIF
jgi:hypothetical protein